MPPSTSLTTAGSDPAARTLGETAAVPSPPLSWLSGACLLAATALILWPLSYTWRDNPDYSYGWGILPVSLLLFYERWTARPAPGAPVGWRLVPWLLPLGALLFLVFRFVIETDTGWRPLLWAFGLLAVGLLLGWLGLAGGRPWLRHFAFPVGFLLLGVPWFFNLEQLVIQGLTRMNALAVAITLELGGVDTSVAGNIIHLPHVDLGVEEACSGILSLQASLMMGFLWGEIYRLAWKNRLVLVAASIALALLGNYLRTLTLGLAALAGGAEMTHRWHDAAGWTVLGLTAAGSWALARFWLRRANLFGKPVPSHAAAPSPVLATTPPPASARASFVAMAALAAALLSTLAVEGWFGWKEARSPRHPLWTPAFDTLASYQSTPLSEITLRMLDCDQTQTGQWTDAQGRRWIGYWFRYLPKLPMNVNGHNPATCLPASGWTQDGSYDPFSANANGIRLNVQPAHFLPADHSAPAYVFWVVYLAWGRDEFIHPPGGLAKLALKWREIREGYRGAGYETLEIALIGAGSYAEAQAAYLQALQTLIRPLPSS